MNNKGEADRRWRGFAFIDSAIGSHEWLTFVEIHADEQGTTAIAFRRRARECPASYGIAAVGVFTDSGSCHQ